jgi:hypothetical protein
VKRFFNQIPRLVLSGASDRLPPLADEKLAEVYQDSVDNGDEVLFVANGYTVSMLVRSNPGQEWRFVAKGEFAEECVVAVTGETAKKRTFWANTTNMGPDIDNIASLNAVLVTKSAVISWFRNSEKVTGRIGQVPSEVKNEVAYHAANRCQFLGCGRDLGPDTLTSAKGGGSYFAPIVAASMHGPRGDPVESTTLAREPSNFLLLCDECDRLINKVAPEAYSVARLRQMRAQSIRHVRDALDTLRYQDVEFMFISGNATDEIPYPSDRDVDEALWSSQLRRPSKNAQSLFSFQGLEQTSHEVGYWSNLFGASTDGLVSLQGKVEALRSGETPCRQLAIFASNGTSILILVGRILGDTPGLRVFEPHRSSVSGGPQTGWRSPRDLSTTGLAGEKKFEVKTVKAHTFNCIDANLVVCFTNAVANPHVALLPITGRNSRLPTIAISVTTPVGSAICSSADVLEFGRAVDGALQTLQERWRIRTVHLYVSAPPSAAVLVGQKLQAHQHINFICYEPLGDEKRTRAPTIEISAQKVRLVGSNLAAAL